MTSNSIRSRIEIGVLMSLGATKLRTGDQSLSFDATIAPLSANGVRAQNLRAMAVTVIEHGPDQFGIYVSRQSRGTTVTHYQSDHVPASMLNKVLLALDYDGPEALNPRLV